MSGGKKQGKIGRRKVGRKIGTKVEKKGGMNAER